MKLFHQVYGEGDPLIIMHGLFGTYENWGTQIKALSEYFQVIAVDMRNHGRSDHDSVMDYPAMAADIVELMDDLGLASANILGHSMGGKAAMQLALNYPNRLRKLIVVDIAPVAYPPHHDEVFTGLYSIQLDQLKSRGDADKQLATHVGELGVRAFLLKNLYRDENKQFRWRMNLDVLRDEYAHIGAAPSGTPFQGKTLFIKGENSHYLLPEHRNQVLTLFPNTSYKLMQGAGHWPHAEKPSIFGKIVLGFLLD
ncbi:alpha/beta fold hydrolase [Pontibacterium granulatum]|uniref:alpha/beta fold hydrolase n=1 Tax=Pontibacterium granulatum TaxID=2036029 RepID=UPI00249CCFE7|nr:alpha/beta fold hydrolase [Pontibacterium granulatum]MDI3322783.1 alpha/beta fold hydrolase [Pontibacterium granulatum]